MKRTVAVSVAIVAYALAGAAGWLPVPGAVFELAGRIVALTETCGVIGIFWVCGRLLGWPFGIGLFVFTGYLILVAHSMLRLPFDVRLIYVFLFLLYLQRRRFAGVPAMLGVRAASCRQLLWLLQPRQPQRIEILAALSRLEAFKTERERTAKC